MHHGRYDKFRKKKHSYHSKEDDDQKKNKRGVASKNILIYVTVMFLKTRLNVSPNKPRVLIYLAENNCIVGFH